MLKKVIAIYAALAIALSGSVALGVYLLSGVIEFILLVLSGGDI